MCGTSSSSPTVSNCTFSGNTAGFYGGGILVNPGSSLTLTGSYFCSNMPEAIHGSLNGNSGDNNMEFCPPPRQIEPKLFGDSDGDDDVDLTDLAAFAANWLVGTD